jgi:non-ribosomal peptide synthetase component E (peptide arylation enzyme)
MTVNRSAGMDTNIGKLLQRRAHVTPNAEAFVDTDRDLRVIFSEMNDYSNKCAAVLKGLSLNAFSGSNCWTNSRTRRCFGFALVTRTRVQIERLPVRALQNRSKPEAWASVNTEGG